MRNLGAEQAVVDAVKARADGQRAEREEFLDAIAKSVVVHIDVNQLDGILKKLGWSRRELARQAGVSRQTVLNAMAEDGGNPTYHTLRAISAAIVKGIAESKAYPGALTEREAEMLLSRRTGKQYKLDLLKRLVLTPPDEKYRKAAREHRIAFLREE